MQETMLDIFGCLECQNKRKTPRKTKQKKVVNAFEATMSNQLKEI